MTNVFQAELWDHRVYVDRIEEVDPVRDLHRFRSRTTGYQGQASFWQVPSPEPELPALVCQRLANEPISNSLSQAAAALAGKLAAQHAASELLFVAVLRAGVPVAQWLTQLLPGSQAVATSLFVGIGIDSIALAAIVRDYPQRQLVFVDGWTGKGGVSRELKRLGRGPLAVLSDPWGVADVCGTREDILSPSACFTGPTTLGFSRTFTREAEQMFAAYRFPDALLRRDFVEHWKAVCPVPGAASQQRAEPDTVQSPAKLPTTELRLHSNEVCRALINSNPTMIYFADSKRIAERDYPALIELASFLKVDFEYDCWRLEALQAKVACDLMLKVPAADRVSK